MSRNLTDGHPLVANLGSSFVLGVACTIAAHALLSLLPAQPFLTGLLLGIERVSSTIDPLFAAIFIATAACYALLVAARRWYHLRETQKHVSTTVSTTSSPVKLTKSGPDKQAQVEQHVTALLALVVNYLERSATYSRSVTDIQSQLGLATSIEYARELIVLLITKSQDAQNDANALRSRLETAQAQISAMREQLETAEEMAALDPLTSVANRRRFDEIVHLEIKKSHHDLTPLSLVMADLDHFKKINDTHGHQMGDAVIKSFAQFLAANVRGTDTVARYGGEEFALVLPRTPTGNAFEIAERIRQKIETEGLFDVTTDERLVAITASFGVAELMDGEGKYQLVRRADSKLYDAKSNGRNRVEVQAVTGTTGRPG